MRRLCDVPTERLEHYAEPVVHVPWCTTVAAALEVMQRRDRQVAAVVNGGGGGRAEMAQAGGSNPDKTDEALELARQILTEALKEQ